MLLRHRRAYGLESLSTTDLSAFYERVKTDPELLDTYYWNMRAKSRRFEPCTADLCRATTLCAMKWWSTKSEYSACVDGVQSSIRNAPSNATLSPSLPGRDALNGNAELQPLAGSSSVAIAMIVLATVVVAVVAVAIVRRLRRDRGASDADQRDVFFFESESSPSGGDDHSSHHRHHASMSD